MIVPITDATKFAAGNAIEAHAISKVTGIMTEIDGKEALVPVDEVGGYLLILLTRPMKPEPSK